MAEGATKTDSRNRWIQRNFDAIKLLVQTGGSGGAGLVGHGPPGTDLGSGIFSSTATSTSGVLASDAAAGTTWLDDDTNSFYVKKINGNWFQVLGFA